MRPLKKIVPVPNTIGTTGRDRRVVLQAVSDVVLEAKVLVWGASRTNSIVLVLVLTKKVLRIFKTFPFLRATAVPAGTAVSAY